MSLSFKLTDDFVSRYRGTLPPFGFVDAGGNSIGELTFIRTYSRVKDDGTKERWCEVCERVINGMYSIQKDWCRENRLPWNDRKAHASAEEAFDRLFHLKWTPPGRGLWTVGTPVVHDRKIAAAQYNCAFVSTGDMQKHDPGAVFAWIADALMLGIGVGFDTDGAKKHIQVREPVGETFVFHIPDSREGWAESIRLLINSYLRTTQVVEFDYSLVREAGQPIKGFGGISSGPGPLRALHQQLRQVLGARVGELLDSRAIVDIANLIGACIISGNVRRSAEIALGESDDADFIDLKNAAVFPARNSTDAANPGWAWMSNNSLILRGGVRHNYEAIAERVINNGEPGLYWIDIARSRGRLADPENHADYRIKGLNPCGEINLESYELCNLVECHLNRADSLDDFKRTLKFAYLFAKTVTLLPTHWPETNAVIQRNRRIGTSLTGIAGFVDLHGLPAFREWADLGYRTIRHYDKIYSEWLCVRESIKVTTVKPSGSVSLLSGATPGVHWPPGGQYYLRAIRFADNDPIVSQLRDAGYRVERDVMSANTVVVYFPIKTTVRRSEHDVSVYEKIHLAAEAQEFWADNSVSVTVSFDKETESQALPSVLRMHEGRLKAVSFLPMGNQVYQQQPYTSIDQATYESYVGQLAKIDMSVLYNNGIEAVGEKYCTNDSCSIG